MSGSLKESALEFRAMCPECGKPMIVLELGGIELDHCLECGGTWLDAGELEWITDAAGVERGAVTSALGGAKGTPHTGRKCPRCSRKLDIIRIGGAPGVEVDRCSRGHGLWLDRGELRGVVQAFGGGVKSDETGALAHTLGDFFRYEFNPSEKGV